MEPLPPRLLTCIVYGTLKNLFIYQCHFSACTEFVYVQFHFFFFFFFPVAPTTQKNVTTWKNEPKMAVRCPTKCSLTPLPQRGGKSDEKLLSQDKGRLIRKNQDLCSWAKDNKNSYSLLPISGQCPDISWEAGPWYA